VVRHLEFPALEKRIPQLRERIHVMTRWVLEAREKEQNLAHIFPHALALSMLHQLVHSGGDEQEIVQNLEKLESSIHEIMREIPHLIGQPDSVGLEINFARQGLKLAMGDV
jgi:hypothetical protein